jgi:hypothetical protein
VALAQRFHILRATCSNFPQSAKRTLMIVFAMNCVTRAPVVQVGEPHVRGWYDLCAPFFLAKSAHVPFLHLHL